jgi:predicted nucleic acid-binding protein
MSGNQAFFDTNILLYMYGGDERKRSRSRRLFQEHARNGRILLSTQVVQEFHAAGSRKLGIPRETLREITRELLELRLITVTAAHISAAVENESRYVLSFRDALIVAAAESANADVLYTEDLNHGQRYGKVLVTNPFRDADPESGG